MVFLLLSIIFGGASAWADERCLSSVRRALVQVTPSPSKGEVFRKFKSLSPRLSDEQVAAKVGSARDPFHLYRAFVPAYYDALQAEGSSALEAVKSQTGWILGDVHPENFGVLLSDSGKAVFTMNDLDDGARGPLVDDVIRFLAAADLYDPTIDLSSLLKEYRRGLLKGKLPGSKTVEKMELKASQVGQVPPVKMMDPESKTLIRGKATDEVSETTRGQLEKAIRKAYGDQVEFKDALEVERVRGGSGGLKRYHALIRVDQKEGTRKRWVVIEFKEMVDASIVPFTSIEQPSIPERVRSGLKATQGKKPSRFYSVQKLGSDTLLLRPRFEGNIGVSLQDLSPKKAGEVMAYESALLGKLHAGSADSPAAYEKSFSKVPDEALISESRRIAELFRTYYRVLKSSRP